MRVVKGKQVQPMDAAALAAWGAKYDEILVDLGTGDGRFVRGLAERAPRTGAIGLDLCAANLRTAARRAPGNALFVVADALALPDELRGTASRVTVHFPWGCLLRALLAGESGLLAGLRGVGDGETSIEIWLNAGALAEVGWTFAAGGERVAAVLRDAGVALEAPRPAGAAELRRLPTTWAKRLAFGRDPRALRLAGRYSAEDGRWETNDGRNDEVFVLDEAGPLPLVSLPA
jgi:hypothetical protein